MRSEVRKLGVGSQTVLSGLFFVLSFSLGSCTALWRPQPRTPLPSVPVATVPSAAQLLAPLEIRRQHLKSLRGLARVAYKDAHEKGTARQAVAVDAPDRFRLELFSPIGIVSLVATDGHNLAAYFPRDKVLYRGAATPTNTARFIQLALSASEITGLLLGLPVLPDQREAGAVHFDEDAGWYRLDLPLTEGEVQTLTFDQKTLRLLGWEVRNGAGTVLAQVSLSDYRPVHGHEFPFAIELFEKQGKQEASIAYEQVELNPPLSDSLFTLVSIPGVQEIDLDTLAAP